MAILPTAEPAQDHPTRSPPDLRKPIVRAAALPPIFGACTAIADMHLGFDGVDGGLWWAFLVGGYGITVVILVALTAWGPD